MLVRNDNYIDLERRFRDLTKEELEASESVASLVEHDVLRADGWAEVLCHPRVVLLAEAGSGKSEEMRQQVVRLRNEGRPAFYLDLTSLDKSPPTDLMDPEEEASFRAWKSDETSTAWFFLDAVDELKLTRGKLEHALIRLSRETSGLLHRMHVVISSRPSDWRPVLDMAIFKAKLPIVALERSTAPEPDEVFLAAIREEAVRHDPGPAAKGEADGAADRCPASAERQADRNVRASARHRGCRGLPCRDPQAGRLVLCPPPSRPNRTCRNLGDAGAPRQASRST